jgi:nitrate reductase molybdenum cofactor assembly chaperone NarJ/NarW
MPSPMDPWDRLAAALDYPEQAFPGALAACREAVAGLSADAAAEVRAFEEATGHLPLARLQELYVESFDLDPQCSLDLSWHRFGDSRQRGEMLAALREDLRRVGVPETGELPDHLSHVLMLLAREEPERAEPLGRLILSALEPVEQALRRRQSPYVHLLQAVRLTVATHPSRAERTAP